MSRSEGMLGGLAAPTVASVLLRVALLVVGVSPFVPLLSERWPGLRPLAELLSSWFELQCHRDEGRLLGWGTHGWPVCARCWGIYVGLGLGALIARPRWLGRHLFLVLLPAALLMLMDVLTESVGLRPPWTELRVLTGVLLGYPAAVGGVTALRTR